ncbi:MAG TPA: NAD(P)/FAD-dependent oxidoreductase [Pyrinomonadaceae bacterium]|nr:NAD(P)/FAD-dependent oxidoreductase [Pyrinomonadaceae bacterium]
MIFSDVTILGGGPGGSATAISLLAHAPALSVTLVEATRYEASRVGESLPPLARPLLETLNLWDAFSALGARESFGTSAVWGQATSVDNEFIFMPANTGWQLDRASFDAMLANEGKKRGAVLMPGTSLRGAQRVDDGWRLSLSDGCQLSTKFVVDATGGSASFARRAGARFVDLDRLVGISRFFECVEADSRLMVETFADGWWYTAGLPHGKRVTCCVTDADLAQRIKLNEPDVWQEQLATTSTVAKITNTRKPCSTITVRSTNSRLLDPLVGESWLAVGDAASRFDPLSSQGIVKALRSGIFASYAIGDLLMNGDDAGLRRYQRYVTEEFKSYTQTRLKYYRQEQRWPNSEFWRRRHEGKSEIILDRVSTGAVATWSA